jgi:hypothetical protein
MALSEPAEAGIADSLLQFRPLFPAARSSVGGASCCQPALEEPALGFSWRELGGTGVRLGSLVISLQSPQEVSSCGMER